MFSARITPIQKLGLSEGDHRVGRAQHSQSFAHLADITAMEPLVGRVLTDDHWLQAPEATGDVGRRAYPVHTPQRENPSKKNSNPWTM